MLETGISGGQLFNWRQETKVLTLFSRRNLVHNQIVQERQKITWRHAIAQVNYLFRDERHDLVNYIPVSKSIPPPSTKIHWLRIEDLDAEWRWLQ